MIYDQLYNLYCLFTYSVDEDPSGRYVGNTSTGKAKRRNVNKPDLTATDVYFFITFSFQELLMKGRSKQE